MKKIKWLLFPESFPPDVRVEKESGALQKEILLYCKAERGKIDKERVENLLVRRVTWRYKLFFQPVLIFYYFYQFIKLLESKDTIHVHDLPMCLPAILSAKLKRAKIICDFHENYPEMVRLNARLSKVVYPFLKLQEILAVKLADHVIVVCQENKKRLSRYTKYPGKITVVSNVADVEELQKTAPKKKINNSIIYTGGFARHRGIITLIKAVEEVNKRNKNAQLILVGKLQKYQKEIIKKTNANIKIIGEVPPEEYNSWQTVGQIAVIPHLRTQHTDNTIPHKLFEFMYFKKPVIVSDSPPLKRIVTETKCGIVFKAGDEKDLAKKMLWLLEHPEKAKKMGEKGHKAVIEKYNWTEEGKRLRDVYNKLFHY